jgi:photosystem II stability/assembly factor-like uncharacterized protein
MDNTGKSMFPGFFIKFISYISLFFFFLSFNFQDSRTSGWYLQTIQDLNGQQVSDLIFMDSLTGYIITNNSNPNDTGYILKSTNGGDNWSIIYRDFRDFSKVKFLNKDTGFVSGGFGTGARLKKTTNGGINWIDLNTPGGGLINLYDMLLFGNDTIWVTETNQLVGGIFRTTNGGLSWNKMDNGIFGSTYPDKIYFYNSRIGFASNSSLLFRTTNSGYNWSQVMNNNGFNDMKFVDSLTGYKAYDSLKKTTDGGLNWQTQFMPKYPGVNYSNDRAFSIYIIGGDTLFGVGGYYWTPNSGYKGLIYKTTNGGLNWGYQIPDTGFGITQLNYVYFINKKIGWAYNKIGKGVHTIIGGDTTLYTGINNNITFVSKEFILFQNFPNPFNSTSNIKYKIEKTSNVKLIIFDVTGKNIKTLINKKQNPGSYEIKFDGNNLSSGIYFYSFFANGVRIDTKKMVMVK